MCRLRRAIGLGLAIFIAFTGVNVVLTQPAPAAVTAPPELPVPPEVRSVNGLAHLRLTAAIDPATQLPAFVFNGQVTPPTIRVRPGDTIVIDYTNALPVRSLPPLDMTNLHTHGLMDSPKAPGDQVIMTMVMPGQTYRYVFGIPKHQPPGLYWYHPHPHGESNRQVASGMSGLIIIDGIEAYAPVVRGLPERDIIVRDYYFDPSGAPLARVRHRARAARAGALDHEPDCDIDDASKGVTINGVPKATITMTPGSRQFLRMANSSANSFFDFKIPGTEFLVVANDGVPLSFHDRSVQGQWLDHVLVPPGGRVEAVVQAPATSGVPLKTLCVDYGPDGDTDPPRDLATIALGTPPALTSALRVAPAAAPEPFGDIHSVHIAARRQVNFTENNPDSEFYINGQLWDPNAPPMFTVQAGTVEEWTVYNYADELHAFHIHQIHFLVEDINGVKQPPSTWRDTVTLPYAKRVHGSISPGVVHLLMDFRSPVIVGTFVFHCHILEHEDFGMMAKIRVVGGLGSAAEQTRNRGYRQGFITTR